jgi:hypothetical protein
MITGRQTTMDDFASNPENQHIQQSNGTNTLPTMENKEPQSQMAA